jgi:putative transposase
VPVRVSPPKTAHRSYSLKVARGLNADKRTLLAAVAAEWTRITQPAFKWYWAEFWKTGRFNSRLRCSGPTSCFPMTRLVTSQKDLMLRALAGQAQSWLSNLENRGRKLGRCITDETLRHEVLWINACQLWRASNADQNATLRKGKGPAAISRQATRIARAWFNHYIRQHALPDPTGLPLQFNVLSARFENASASRHRHFGYWVSLSTLERGRRIVVPVEPHAYFEAAGGEVAKTLTLREKAGELYLDLVRELPCGEWTRSGVPVLALDLGLRNFLACSEGDLRGEGFITALRRYDRQLLVLQRGLQGAGIVRLASCARYRNLIARIRRFIKNSVERWTGSVLRAHAPRRVVLERLNFVSEDSGLGRRMNRLLRHFGQQVFKACVTSWAELKGFEVVEVEAAYSSQMCSSCGFVHRANRKGNSFGCVACGHLAHADVNAAKNLRGRSAQGAFPASGGRHAWWAAALQGWLSRLREGWRAAPPGSAWQARLVWRARAGADALLKEKRGLEAAQKVFQQGMGVPGGAAEFSLHETIFRVMTATSSTS